ncbi:MAG: Spy/CpxP family protein refolding chaperone [Proteobacteria bacterium]|nr:Spy/CpxP family protein refolding chaperone [Pseudomonadota bacterium]
MTRFPFTQRLAATALVAALAGIAAPAFAQPGPGGGSGGGPMAQQMHGPRGMTPEQRQQFIAKRMEAFKQKLQLTPAQEPAWTSFVQSMQPGARADHARLDMQGMDKLTTPERIDRMRAMRAQRMADMDRRGDAVKEFYAQLTQAQQKTFDAEGARMYGMYGQRGGRWADQQGRGMHRHGWGPGAQSAPGAAQ